MSNVISFESTVSIASLRTAIPAIGEDVTLIVTGEPGCGKSSILKALKEEHGEKYHYVYLDAPTLDIGDVTMKIPVHETKRLEQYISELFPRDGKPIIVMIDEYLKCAKMLKLLFTRLMLERTVGDWPLPKGSIVFATSNNSSDGVGDTVEGHVGNRVCIVRMQKPSAAEWLPWATENRVNSMIRMWVHTNPRALHSYLDGGQQDNPYIFNPTRGTVSYVSPRSLEKAGKILDRKHILGDDFVQAALAGTVGQAAAKDMAAYLSLDKEILRTKDILKDPENVPLTDNPAALLMMIFNALDDIVTQDDLSAFMKFLYRAERREMESVFFLTLMQSKRTIRLAKDNKDVTQWASKNIDLV